jgi:hypothetical protein
MKASKKSGFSKVVMGLILIFLIAGLLLPTVTASAAPLQVTCKQVGSYTDYYLNKPSLLIYYPNGHPEASKITVKYYNNLYWENVPNSDWGVRLDAPQNKSGGWSYYFIASRWYYGHWGWNDDWRWKVTICE